MKRNTVSDTQEHARQFNEEEAIWRRYQEKRALRRLRGDDPSVPEALLDQLDWQEAEREVRSVRAVAR
jgi:hypothetical protein